VGTVCLCSNKPKRDNRTGVEDHRLPISARAWHVRDLLQNCIQLEQAWDTIACYKVQMSMRVPCDVESVDKRYWKTEHQQNKARTVITG